MNQLFNITKWGVTQLAVVGFLLFATIPLKAEQTLPKEQGLVNDYAGVLSDEQYKTLTQKLRKLEDSTQIQIAIVFEKTHGGYGAFDRAMFLARGWDVGHKEDRSGVLIYVAIDDRDLHIVTSDKTQGVLTDGFIGVVRDQFLKPNFKKQDYYTGVDQATDAIIQQMKGEFKSKKDPYTYTYSYQGSGWVGLFLMLFMPFMFFFVVYRVFKAVRRGVTIGGQNSGCLNALLINSMLNSGGSSSRSHWDSGSSSGWGSSSSSDWGGFGGGGSGFNGGGAGGSW